MSLRRYEICGGIASGKTTFCQGLENQGYAPIFENFQKNPFFEDFYDDPVSYSFETEITFLLQHYNLIKKQSNRTTPIITDYSLVLDMAYADINLTGDRQRIFFEIVTELEKEIGLPDKIIHLDCSEEILLERIIRRSRDAETSITLDYLRSLTRAISLRVNNISSKINTFTIDSNAIDFRPGIEGIKGFDQFLAT